MRYVKLTNCEEHALVDNDLFAYIIQWQWRKNAQGYAVRRIYEGHGKTRHAIDLRMHRQLMGEPDNREVDHIDGNGLNNQLSNLRIATHGQNMINRGKQINNTSGYKGVSWSRQNKKWYAWITLSGHTKCLGFYIDILEAAQAYNQVAKKYFGKFARLNKI